MEKTVLKKGQRNCPKCNSNWDGESILQTFIKERELGVECWQKGMSDKQIEKCVKECYAAPYLWQREIGIELPNGHPDYYDGVSYIQCPDCKAIFDALAGEETDIDLSNI